MEPQSPQKNQKLAGIIGLIVIVAAIGVGVWAFSPKKDQTAVASPSPSPSATATTSGEKTASPAPSTATAAYKDGTYSADGTYISPGGQETVHVTLTLQAGKVASSTVTTSGNNPTGKQFQDKFIANYQSLVTGKSIDDITLSKVSGSSLTSGGFNKAVTQIKADAQA